MPSCETRALRTRRNERGVVEPNSIDPERIFAPLSRAKKLLLAVSGGPDSVALLLLAFRWCHRGGTAIEVATIDHGLRTDSRREAETVAAWARGLGFPHHLLRWEGDKPKTRLQERAREARYALLEACALHIGADHIVTAHHADDQAETVLLRLTRGSGPAGLAGMSLFAARGDLILARPLLDTAKADLVAFCEKAGQPFFRDASNDDPAFARTRLRYLGPRLAAAGLDREALLRLACRAARAETALSAAAASTRAALPAWRTPGRTVVASDALTCLPDEILLRILDTEIRALSGGIERLRLDRLERAASGVAAALHAKTAFVTTLGHARIAVMPDGTVEITATRRHGRFGAKKP